jgi:AmmeMemoRadiSam system radical SAM enzyme/AmmeMemoRadiSam system protein B/AmmeMemoRadiSam system protein A
MNTKEAGIERLADGAAKGSWWQAEEQSNRITCTLCPRQCSLKSGDRGFCFVRENRDDAMVLTTYGRSTGFCIDPIEKKPLNHFYPGTPVLSFGTAGCNLGCQFCQNWDISKSRQVERLSETAEPDAIAQAALATGCTSVAFTYNDPIIWAEYAIDTAKACQAVGIKTVAVTAGYISADARPAFFEPMDAANVDLKAFTEEFYHKITYSHLEPILETLRYLKHETDVWFELTNLIIPQANDNPGELRKMCDWVLDALGDEVPIHFTAFHPDFRMMDRERTSPEKLFEAYEIARSTGLKFPYVGNIHDVTRQSTLCPGCGELLIERDWYQLGTYAIEIEEGTSRGVCSNCRMRIPGQFQKVCGNWGSQRQPIRISEYAGFNDPKKKFVIATEDTAAENPAIENAAPELHQIKDDSVTTDTNDSNVGVTTQAPTPPQPLKLNAITAEQKNLILAMAANGVAATVTGQAMKTPPEAFGDFAKSIVMGAFVTLKRGEILRGCCGVLGKPMALGPAVSSAAVRTAKDDQRMAPISPSELPFLSLDVTLLGPFKRIEAEGAARAEAIKIGRQGLMIQRGKHSGLLLPSVATERGWNAVQFLQAVCTKAGLPIGAWESNDCQVMTFDGQSIASTMSEFIPLNLPNTADLPLNQEQVSAYAQVVGQNIVAMATGGTPSYVITHLPDVTVNAIVLSMQWGADENSAAESDTEAKRIDKQQGNAVQVSFRPGVPLQSTLFQMCQNAAQLFQQQRFAGQLQIGLTIGFDPAMHGYGYKADLSGVETDKRAVIISDARHCGLAFDPSKSAEELRDVLRRNMPVSSRDGIVHTVQVLTTMPHVISVTGPNPIAGSGIRPPAVAGKFYPAEDAARRAFVGTLVKGAAPETCSPLAIMVPHAGLKYSGSIAAQVWRSVEGLADRTLLIISPKHTGNGVNWSVCPFDSWRVSGTTSFEGDRELAQKIVESVTELHFDAASHAQEHGIEVQLPLLESIAPTAKVVGIALHGGSWEDVEVAATQLSELVGTLEKPPLFVISSDMNHYAPDQENRRRDRLALDALASGDPEKLIQTCRENEISMCGMVPAAFVMETLRKLGKSFRVVETGYATSGDVTGDKSQVVGYAGALFVEA